MDILKKFFEILKNILSGKENKVTGNKNNVRTGKIKSSTVTITQINNEKEKKSE